MRRLYLVIPDSSLTARLVEALRADGLGQRDMQLFAERPDALAGLSVSVSGLRVARRRLASRAVAGAAVGLAIGLPLMALGNDPLLLPLVVVAGVLVAVVPVLWRPLPEGVQRLRPELRPDDVLMLVDVPDERLAQVEQTIKARHPEIRVQGTDPAGSPPFP